MRAASNNEKSSGFASASLGVINSITAGINKKSFFKGFLSRGSSQKNETKTKSLNGPNATTSHRTSSYVGGNGQLSNMQNAAMNMMFKNKNGEENMESANRSFNRHFGKDITSKVLNSSGTISL